MKAKDEKAVSRMISEQDIYLFCEGTHFDVANMLGARPVFNSTGQADGCYFAVWAPNAKNVSVVGDWNDWNPQANPMNRIGGLWELYIDGVGIGWTYKFAVTCPDGSVVFKADPCARYAEERPRTASRTWSDSYQWHDGLYRIKHRNHSFNQPMVIYEMHLGSWSRHEDGSVLSYRELAEKLSRYLSENGYTHVELMPPAEHPYDGSWGYQVTGYFAPTSRYGTPEDFKYLIDTLHGNGIGVIADWVPAHFPRDEHGLRMFDGTPLYEYPVDAEQKQWGTLKFNLGRKEVQSFLISNAVFWAEEFHLDGLRVDAVSCMLYLDYEGGEWKPNAQGGRENLEAIDFLKRLNTVMKERCNGTLMIAEESTDFPKVTAPVADGGLGFTYKWDMGWMNDSLKYMQTDPLFRGGCHNLMTFSMMYAYSENFILPVSHDECVHGKKTVLDKMSGDYWQKFASLRAFYSYMFAHPGKKLLFMGCELGQFMEWRYYEDIEWELLRYETHRGLYNYVHDLIALYKGNSAFWNDGGWDGFKWSNADDAQNSVFSFVRKNNGKSVLTVLNMTPVARYDYWVGVEAAGTYRLVLNSDSRAYGGEGHVVAEVQETDKTEVCGLENRLRLTLPPLSALFYEKDPD